MGYFARRFFPGRHFPPRFFPPAGAIVDFIWRLLRLGAEGRLIALGAEVRAIVLGAESRAIVLEDEQHNIVLSAEGRLIALAADEGMSDTGKWDAKDPDEVLFYSIDWTLPLDGDTLSGATWTPPAGITIASPSIVGAVTKAKFSGGTADTSYAIKCTVTTTGGQTLERTRTLKVKSK